MCLRMWPTAVVELMREFSVCGEVGALSFV